MIWESIIGIVLSLGWIYLLFHLGSKDKDTIFYTLIYLPLLPGILLFAILFPLIIANLLTMFNVWAIILLIVFVAERLAWGLTLKEISGEKKLVWFYIAYSVPFLGWFLYQITKY